MTAEGKLNLQDGFPEHRIYRSIPEHGIAHDELDKLHPSYFKFGFGNGIKKNLFCLKDKKVFKVAAVCEDEEEAVLKAISNGQHCSNSKLFEILRKRKLVQQVVVKYFKVGKGPQYAAEKLKL